MFCDRLFFSSFFLMIVVKFKFGISFSPWFIRWTSFSTSDLRPSVLQSDHPITAMLVAVSIIQRYLPTVHEGALNEGPDFAALSSNVCQCPAYFRPNPLPASTHPPQKKRSGHILVEMIKTFLFFYFETILWFFISSNKQESKLRSWTFLFEILFSNSFCN